MKRHKHGRARRAIAHSFAAVIAAEDPYLRLAEPPEQTQNLQNCLSGPLGKTVWGWRFHVASHWAIFLGPLSRLK